MEELQQDEQVFTLFIYLAYNDINPVNLTENYYLIHNARGMKYIA
jgi:hypothetical protein